MHQILLPEVLGELVVGSLGAEELVLQVLLISLRELVQIDVRTIQEAVRVCVWSLLIAQATAGLLLRAGALDGLTGLPVLLLAAAVRVLFHQ